MTQRNKAKSKIEDIEVNKERSVWVVRLQDKTNTVILQNLTGKHKQTSKTGKARDENMRLTQIKYLKFLHFAPYSKSSRNKSLQPNKL